MGADGATNIVFSKEIATAEDPAAKRAEKIEEYRGEFSNPYVAAGLGYLEDVIEPAETRAKVIAALEARRGKTATMPKKKHGNIPL